MSLSHDAFAAEKEYFYNYSELRGFTRALRGPSGEWKKAVNVNDECKGLKCVSMVLHKGNLLVRHSGLEDQPFVCYDKETLKPCTDGPKFKFPNDSTPEKLLKRLDWSERTHLEIVTEEENTDDEQEEEKQNEE